MSAGDNYGLNPNYEYYEYQLDSYDATKPYSSRELATDWPIFNVSQPLEDTAAIKIIEVQIPFSYFVINSTNKTFHLTDAGVTNAVVLLEEGNYNQETFRQEVESALIAASAVANSYTVNIAGPDAKPMTNKMEIIRTDGTNFTLTFGGEGDTGLTNPRFVMGFPAGSTSSVPGGVLVSPYAINITGPPYMYLNSKKFGSTLQNLIPEGARNFGGGSMGSQITKIPVNVNPGGVIVWADPAPLYWFDMNEVPSFSDFDLYLTLGNSSEILRLNGLNFSVKMGVLRKKVFDVQTVDSAGKTIQPSSLKRRR
jgi:hypothetical protein